MENHKRCSRCGETLAHTEFYQRRDGTPFQPCKRCTRERVKADRLANPEKVKARKLAYCEANREREAERAKRWAADHPDQVKANKARYYARRRDDLIAYTREWRRRFPEQSAVAIKRARAKRADYYRAYWRLAAALRSARKRSAFTLPIMPQQIRDKVRYWGERCWICGGAYEALDHFKPLAKGGPHVLANLRPICRPCNSRKLDHWPIHQEDLLRWLQLRQRRSEAASA